MDAERAQQGRAVYAEAHDVGVGRQPVRRTIGVADADPHDAIIPRGDESGNGGAVAEHHAACRAQRREFTGEAVGVAGFVGGRVGAAGDAAAYSGQRGLDRRAFIGGFCVQQAAGVAHHLCGVLRGLPVCRAGIKMQDAAHQLVVLNAGLGT